MGTDWTHLKPSRTIKETTITDNHGNTEHRTEYEYCMMCSKTDCDLYGNYGTWNAFGSFNGICKECLDKCKSLAKGETELDWMKRGYVIKPIKTKKVTEK